MPAMADPTPLEEIAPVQDSTLFAPFVLTPLRIIVDLPLLTRRFKANYLKTCQDAASQMDAEQADDFMAKAHQQVSRGMFVECGSAFRFALLSSENLPFLIWLLGRAKHPEKTEEYWAARVKNADYAEVLNRCIEISGIWAAGNPKKKAPAASPVTPENPSLSTGPASSGT